MMGQSLVIIPTPSLQRANHKWPAMRAISSRHMHRQAHPHVRFFSVTPFLPPVYIPVAARIFQYVETSYGRRDNLKYRIACSIDPRIGPLERAWLDHSYEWNKPGQLPAASLIPNCSTYVFARHTAELHWKSHDPCSTPRPLACEDIILFSLHAASPICLGYFFLWLGTYRHYAVCDLSRFIPLGLCICLFFRSGYCCTCWFEC
jgi:hypothetical protein